MTSSFTPTKLLQARENREEAFMEVTMHDRIANQNRGKEVYGGNMKKRTPMSAVDLG